MISLRVECIGSTRLLEPSKSDSRWLLPGFVTEFFFLPQKRGGRVDGKTKRTLSLRFSFRAKVKVVPHTLKDTHTHTHTHAQKKSEPLCIIEIDVVQEAVRLRHHDVRRRSHLLFSFLFFFFFLTVTVSDALHLRRLLRPASLNRSTATGQPP